MRIRARVDDIQKAVVLELRRHGATVVSLAPLGNGIPDIAVGYGGKTVLMELKSSPSSKLTPDERAFFDEWRGAALVVSSPEQALKAIEDMEKA